MPAATKLGQADVRSLEGFFRKSKSRINKSKEKVAGLIREDLADKIEQPFLSLHDMLADLDAEPLNEEVKAETKQVKQTQLVFT